MSIPVIIIGGFLGAGKTTLLNHILSENHGVRAGVLVNDFGAINIDAKLVVGVEGETISLANGCVCCTIRGDLISACLGLLRRPKPPELVIIETSGVADPMAVANSFLEPDLQAALSLDCILAVVDAEQFPALRGEPAAVARAQILAADMVVLNKMDLVDGEDLAGVRALVHDITPQARILETNHGKVPLELVLGTGQDEGSIERAAVQDHSSHHHHPFTTWHWTDDRPLSLHRLRLVFDELPNTVYRAKGIVYLEDLPAYQVILQMVGGRCRLSGGQAWGETAPRSEIVMIATEGGFDGDHAQRALDACAVCSDMTPPGEVL